MTQAHVSSAGRRLDGVEGLRAAIGQDLGCSDWVEITQDRVDEFARATGDFQWIHIDPERAANGPFGGTVAHGYLSLSLLPILAGGVFSIRGPRLAINYGLNKVRFPEPVRVGSRVRARVRIESVTSTAVGVQVVVNNVIEIHGAAKPACVAETVRLLVF